MLQKIFFFFIRISFSVLTIGKHENWFILFALKEHSGTEHSRMSCNESTSVSLIRTWCQNIDNSPKGITKSPHISKPWNEDEQRNVIRSLQRRNAETNHWRWSFHVNYHRIIRRCLLCISKTVQCFYGGAKLIKSAVNAAPDQSISACFTRLTNLIQVSCFTSNLLQMEE